MKKLHKLKERVTVLEADLGAVYEWLEGLTEIEHELRELNFWKADRNHSHTDLYDRMIAIERCLGRKP